MLNRAFSEGLVTKGWRVEMTTASTQAPTDLSGYDLLVLGAPTYDWKPAKRIQRYLEQLGDLGGQRTVAILSAAGTTSLSLPMMENLVREANGDLVASYALWTLVPNRIEHGIDDPEEIMLRAARAIPLPRE
jgi:flavorubredoxin